MTRLSSVRPYDIPKSSSDNNSPSMEDIHLGPVPGRPSTHYLQLSTPRTEEKTEEHIELEDCDATLNTKPMEVLTDREGGEGTVALHFQEITSSRTVQRNPTVPQYIPDRSSNPQNKGKGVPCQHCFRPVPQA
jgi:hypothetical protein